MMPVKDKNKVQPIDPRVRNYMTAIALVITGMFLYVNFGMEYDPTTNKTKHLFMKDCSSLRINSQGKSILLKSCK